MKPDLEKFILNYYRDHYFCDQLSDEEILDIKLEIKECIKEFGPDETKRRVKQYDFILRFFPPETLTISDCINGLFIGWNSDDWDPQIFEKIPERIYTDAEFLSFLKSNLQYIEKIASIMSYKSYREIKESLSSCVPDSVRLFIELECS